MHACEGAGTGSKGYAISLYNRRHAFEKIPMKLLYLEDGQGRVSLAESATGFELMASIGRGIFRLGVTEKKRNMTWSGRGIRTSRGLESVYVT